MKPARKRILPVKKVVRKSGRGTQYAALCYRVRKGKSYEILLVTSRGAGRWIPPKGWPMKGLSPEETAATEALEEAGVKGRVHGVSLGRYKYTRTPDESRKISAEAYVFPLEVRGFAKTFKEKGQRQIKWFSPKKAAMVVREPKLKKIIRDFDPRHLKSA